MRPGTCTRKLAESLASYVLELIACIDLSLRGARVQCERTPGAVLCAIGRGTIRREPLSECELLVFLDPSRERFHGTKRLALYADPLTKGNGGGSGTEVRSTVAIPSPFPVITIMTLSFPSETSAS